jgi:hypothetical protein
MPHENVPVSALTKELVKIYTPVIYQPEVVLGFYVEIQLMGHFYGLVFF